jgi:signal transduction histidine kinase/CheY-like chemotaxis protein/ligand-binding sensor domain-containing protein
LRLTLLSIFVVHLSFGQVPIYSNYTHYTTKDGLPQSNVTEVQQDADGFIWVATLSGIARFDGRKFTPFNNSSEKGTSLSGNLIGDIHIDDQNMLWIMHMSKNMDLMNPRTFKVQQNVSPVRTSQRSQFKLDIGYPSPRLIIDASQRNWFVDEGDDYHLYDSSNYRLSKLFLNSQTVKRSKVLSFLEDKAGRLWLMTFDGLEVSDSTWSLFRKIPYPQSLRFTPQKAWSLRAMIELPDGRLFFSDMDHFILYDPVSGEFKRVELPRKEIITTKTDKFVFDKQGRVIFELAGLVYRLEHDDTLSFLWEFPERDDLYLNSLFVDQSNTLWVAANTGGLYSIDLNTPSFSPRRYTYNMLVDALSDEMGIDPKQFPTKWKKKGWSYWMRYHYFQNELLMSNTGPHYEADNALYALEAGKISRIPFINGKDEHLAGIVHRDGIVYAVTSGGNLYRRLSEKTEMELVTNLFLNVSAIGTPRPISRHILHCASDNDFLWVLTSQEILKYSFEGVLIETYQDPNSSGNFVQLLQTDPSSDDLWITSLGGGVIKFNKKEFKVKRAYSVEDGLSDNNVAAIAGDELGNIWIATFNGLSRLNEKENIFTHYILQDGLLESEFNRHHVLKLPDGRIAFGGTEGYVLFDPIHFSNDEFQPFPQLTTFMVNGKEVSLHDSSGILTTPLNSVESVLLKYDQNSIAFKAVPLQFNSPSKNKLRYRLLGFVDRWIEINEEERIRFENLPFGEYDLEINAANTEGVWSQKIKTLNIRILPPPWLSWWAFVAYGLTMIIGVAMLVRNYKRRLIRSQEEAFNRKEALRLKEMDEMKTRFFSNITHEFRTPLTLILSPLDKHIRDKSFSPDVLEILKSNYRHGSHLLKLVNQLLDIAKLESGNMQLNEASGELLPFVQGCLDQFIELADQKDISLSLSSGNVTGTYLFDKGNWEKILFNLLSNAIKFTASNGAVQVAIQEVEFNDELAIQLVVMDSGIGIKEEALPKLFDRFYQVDDTTTREQEGTGIGLALVKELTELMRGSISVESKVGEGTTFTVLLPISKFSETAPTEDAQEIAAPNEAIIASNDELPLLLVVEDNQELRAFIVESLAHSWQVMEASNGGDAWQLIQQELPDIVISDVMMPGMSGYELCQLTKGDIRTAHINFIMLTAKTAQESKEKGLEAGADDYLTKPFHVNELELRIRNRLAHQRHIREYLQNDLLKVSPGLSIPSVEDAFVTKLQRYIDDHIGDTSLGIDQLTEHFAMSRSTLNRKFKNLLNISPSEYIKMYRLQHAALLLKAGALIADVAHKVGFESASYFSQCFREVYALTPTEFQKTIELNQN